MDAIITTQLAAHIITLLDNAPTITQVEEVYNRYISPLCDLIQCATSDADPDDDVDCKWTRLVIDHYYTVLFKSAFSESLAL